MKKLIAIILLLTFMMPIAGCSGGDPKHDPWAWAQELRADDISWCFIAKELSRDEIAELTDLINDLKKSDFTENVNWDGGTPEYTVGFVTKDGSDYIFRKASTIYGEWEFEFDGRDWWIDNEALSSFIKVRVDEYRSTVKNKKNEYNN